MPDRPGCVYLLSSERRAYIGATVDVKRRVRQHNGLISGGAKRTKGRVWTLVLTVVGFSTWKETLRFERAFQRSSRRCRCIRTRIDKLNTLLDSSKTRWKGLSVLPSSSD